MVEYGYQEEKDIYKNTVGQIPVTIGETIQFPIHVQEACRVQYVDIYLIKNKQDVKGTISFLIRVDERSFRYTINTDLLASDNSPLRLIFDECVYVEKVISVGIALPPEVHGDIYLWTNVHGPCVCIRGVINHETTFLYSPLISILTPTYNTQIDCLKSCIESVSSQVYPLWELCLVDDGSKNKDVLDYLKSIKEPRIKVVFNKNNNGIAQATNEALKIAAGEYVALLDHDDMMASNALHEMVQRLNDDRNLDMIYSDEDKVDANGRYYSAFYKPDWNYSLFLSHMYTCHLSIYRRTIANEIKGFRKEYDGSQDYDFVLRFIEKTNRIGHVSKVLYHWRVTKGSTSQDISNKPNARISAVRALSEHLKRTGKDALVYSGQLQGYYRVQYHLPKTKPKVILIVPFKDHIYLVRNFIDTLKITSYPNYEVVFVDNGSVQKETHEYIKSIKISDKRYSVIKYDIPFNFSAINNYAAMNSKETDFYCFMNNDIEIMEPEWLCEMIQQFMRPEVAIVGAKLLYLNHNIQHAGVFIGVGGVAAHGHKNMWDFQPGYFGRPHCVQEISAVTGACMAVRASDFKTVGGFDEKLPRAFNDIDLCLKIREKGKLVVYTPYARLYHRESVSRGPDTIKDKIFMEAIQYMDRKWHVLTYIDPYYNPNLTRTKEDFSPS